MKFSFRKGIISNQFSRHDLNQFDQLFKTMTDRLIAKMTYDVNYALVFESSFVVLDGVVVNSNAELSLRFIVDMSISFVVMNSCVGKLHVLYKHIYGQEQVIV